MPPKRGQERRGPSFSVQAQSVCQRTVRRRAQP